MPFRRFDYPKQKGEEFFCFLFLTKEMDLSVASERPIGQGTTRVDTRFPIHLLEQGEVT